MSYRFADSFRAGPGWNSMNTSWWTDEQSETCRVSWQNKFVKLVHLVGFVTKKFVTMHGPMNLKCLLSMSRSSMWSLSLKIHHQNTVWTSPLPFFLHLSLPPHYSRFNCPNSVRYDGLSPKQLQWNIDNWTNMPQATCLFENMAHSSVAMCAVPHASKYHFVMLVKRETAF